MLPPILVPRQNEFAPGYSLLPAQQAPVPQQPQYNVNYANNGFGPVDGFSNNSCSSGQNSPMSPISSISSNSSAAFQQQSYQYPTMGNTPSPPFCQENNTYMAQQQLQQQQEVEKVHYVEPEYWANVAYYELNHRVGEQFRCNTNSYSLTIDGFTHPSSSTENRFCLGQLTNVNRNNTVSILNTDFFLFCIKLARPSWLCKYFNEFLHFRLNKLEGLSGKVYEYFSTTMSSSLNANPNRRSSFTV